jgi:hypothetical protein
MKNDFEVDRDNAFIYDPIKKELKIIVAGKITEQYSGEEAKDKYYELVERRN